MGDVSVESVGQWVAGGWYVEERESTQVVMKVIITHYSVTECNTVHHTVSSGLSQPSEPETAGV